MKLLLIEGSPKLRRSASSILLDGLRDHLEDVEIDTCAVKSAADSGHAAAALTAADAVVLAFPLYVDGIPSHFLRFLTEMENVLREAEHKPLIYALMNCGFYEGEQCAPALEMVQNWCLRSGVSFGGGLAVGAGGALTGLDSFTMGRGPKQTLGKELKVLAERICAGQCAAPVCISLDMAWEDYQTMGECGWRKAAQKQGLQEKDLSRPCPAPNENV